MPRDFLLSTLPIIIAVLAFVGCGTPNTERIADVDPVLWMPGEPAVIEYQNSDTAGIYRLDLILVSRSDFDRQPLGFSVIVTAPNGTWVQDTVAETVLIDRRDGGIYGHFVRPYRDTVRLGQVGNYVFSIAPSRNVVGVKAAGMNISEIANGKE